MVVRRAARAAPATGCWRRCGRTGGTDCPADGALGRRHAEYYVELAERPPAACRAPTSGRGSSDRCPTPTTCGRRSSGRFADRDADLALRLVASLPEVLQVRVGYEAAEWAERALDLHRTGATRCSSPRRRRRPRGMERRRLRPGPARWRPRSRARRPARGTARTGHPADVAADVALYEGDVDAAAAPLHGRGRPRPPATATRSGWCGRSTTSRSATRCGGRPSSACPPRRRACEVAETTGQPDRAVDGPLRARAGAQEVRPRAARSRCSTRRRELAASVHNFWWEGIALMEAAATRAVHGDAAEVAARRSSTCSTTGTGSATGPSSGSTCATSSGCSSGSAPTRTPPRCTTAWSRGQAVAVAAGPGGRAGRRPDGPRTPPRPGRAPGSPRPRRSGEPAACCAATAESGRCAGRDRAPEPVCMPRATQRQLPRPTLGTDAARGRAGITPRRASCH